MAPNSTVDFTAYDRYIDANFEGMISELRAFCSTPTLAGQLIGLEEGVRAVRGLLEPLGAKIKVVPLEGAPPAVIAELGSGPRTLLNYNHYDVQPPEPLELWESPPFAGDVRDGRFYARGVADDRGDFISRIFALRAYRATIGELPLRLRWLIEGEEEIGSPHLEPAVRGNAADLAADWCVWEAADRTTDGTPRVICGVKGMLYVELRAAGPNHDAHSGRGGILPNPAWRLVSALNTLRDANGNFVMDGLSDLVDPPDPDALAAAEAMPIDEQAELGLYGISGWQRGLRGHDAVYAELFEPTANIAGFTSGYSGEGAKTIVPSKAVVKMDFRLVPRQTPEKMLDLLRVHLDARGFNDVEIVSLGGLYPAMTPLNSPIVKASLATWEDLGAPNVVLSPVSGGSGPMSLMTEILGIPTVAAGGVAYEGSRVHSPNENVKLANFKEAIRYWGRFYHRASHL